jgi:putative DNA primase/helicase
MREGLPMGEAARTLGWVNGAGHTVVAAPSKPAPVPPEKPPADAPEIPGTVYDYRDTDGSLLFKIQRIEASTDDAGEPVRKSFRPYTWRNGRWSAKGWPAPRPLFGLELLTPGKRVLLVEGEKACLAARQLLPSHVCMTWAGGAAATKQTDWSALVGYDVDLWPDADAPGAAAMAQIAGLLLPHVGESQLRLLKQDGQPDGWDLADALAEGWDTARVIEHVKRPGGVHTFGTLQVGKPHDGGKPPIDVGDDKSSSIYTQYEALGLSRNSGGIVYANEANALKVLAGHAQFKGKLWINEFSARMMIDTADGARVFDKRDAIQALVYMQDVLGIHKMALSAVERAAVMAGYLDTRHPLKTWLSELTWDGVPRMATMMSDAFGMGQDDYTAAIGRCWLVSMIARIFDPGCKADCMPVLMGGQGEFKSTSLSVLAGEYFLESHYDPIRKREDFLGSLQGCWLIEIPEMHKIGGNHDNTDEIKGILSCSTDSFREPYGTHVRVYPRQCIFSGTTNREQWNPDPTGGRRFWPGWVRGISLDYLREQREQLFAEALYAWRGGVLWYDPPLELATAAQESVRITDEWETLILDYVHRCGKQNGVSVSELLQSCLDIKPIDWSRPAQNRVGAALRATGYMRKQLRVNGKQEWLYVYSQHVAKAQAATMDDF